MPAMRKRNQSAESTVTADTPASRDDGDHHHNQMSDYELTREHRIRENRERLGKLGIMDLSLKLKSSNLPPKRTRSIAPKTPPTLNPSAPLRRSSRLQNVTPVTYAEVPAVKGEFEGKRKIVIEEGAKPEVYTGEHEKLLGNTEKSWTLFVDGVGKDGKRIYDSIQGKTCHQCRQKTLGYRTRCCQCTLVQGQFCGDCLYMRYGEHVLEALQNPSWICPVCRGICNCSLCRQSKGWAPTGPLYKKISALGYKSVAHYLIQTRRTDSNVEKDEDDCNPVSVKRSLPFSDGVEIKENYPESLKPLAETESAEGEVSAKRSLFSSDAQDQLEKVECLAIAKAPASSSKHCPDSIAGRLRSRLKKP